MRRQRNKLHPHHLESSMVNTLAQTLSLAITRVYVLSCSDVSHPLQPHGLLPARLLCPWNFPGKNTGVRCHFLLRC